MRFPIGGERWLKLTNSLGKLQIELLTRTRDQVVLLENEANLCDSRRQASYFFTFECGWYNKTLNDWSLGKQRVLKH